VWRAGRAGALGFSASNVVRIQQTIQLVHFCAVGYKTVARAFETLDLEGYR